MFLGCHSPGENLTSVCVKDTKSNLCTGNIKNFIHWDWSFRTFVLLLRLDGHAFTVQVEMIFVYI